MNSVLEKIGKLKVVPVVAIQDAEDADGLAEALLKGGLPCAEITLRTAAAQEAIRRVARHKDMLVGAGTVLKVEQVKAAIDAGAEFIVAPGLNPKVVRFCLSQDIPVTPGVCNPTDIETALDLGLKILKFFPAEAAGGINLIKAVSAPYQMVKFIPTGGIGPANLASYLKHPKVFACGGSWMVKSDLIAQGRFDTIGRLTRQAVELVQTAVAGD